MNGLIICANPSESSFCNAIAETAVSTFRDMGSHVVYHDLYREEFPAILPAGEANRLSPIPDLIKRHCDDLVNADGIVIVHPNWWGQPPAILKGWIDRVIRVDVAYRFLEGDSGEGVPVGLLKARSAIVFNTSNTESVREQAVFGDPLETIWRNCVFGLCGITDVHRKTYGMIVTSNIEQRRVWLRDAANTVKHVFGQAPK